jgi:hypothetical protein
MRLGAVLVLVITSLATAFNRGNTGGFRTTTSLASSPKTSIDKGGYGLLGSLSRQGPVPVVIRLFQPDTYKAAVEKYMTLEGCDRTTAQANMDAYFQDPNGWAGKKIRSKKNGTEKQDDEMYIGANQDPKAIALTAVWATGIIGLFTRILQVQLLDQ